MSKTSSDPFTRHSLSGPAMGATFSAVFFAPADFDTEALLGDLQAAVDRVERQMSTWEPDSDINRLSGTKPGEWADLPAELCHVLTVGLDIGRASGGAFDISIGDLVNAWGFGPPIRKPDIARIRALTGDPRPPANVVLEVDSAAGRARLLAPMTLDLSGIAKGFGVDELGRVVTAAGINNFLVGIDGEMLARGTKRAREPWAVVIEEPTPGKVRPMSVIELLNRAIATSGSYRNRLLVGEVKLSHTMDPRSARPLQNGIASVSVVADTCMEADAWATALMVLGPEEGPALARARGFDALFVLEGPEGPQPVPVGLFALPGAGPDGAA